MDVSNVDQEIHELKQRVAKLESQVAFMLRNSGFDYPEPSVVEVSPEVADLVRRGRKTEAIKLFRQETGAGLKDAKRFIESLEV
jgi:ribosomal protein L7/L12